MSGSRVGTPLSGPIRAQSSVLPAGTSVVDAVAAAVAAEGITLAVNVPD